MATTARGDENVIASTPSSFCDERDIEASSDKKYFQLSNGTVITEQLNNELAAMQSLPQWTLCQQLGQLLLRGFTFIAMGFVGAAFVYGYLSLTMSQCSLDTEGKPDGGLKCSLGVYYSQWMVHMSWSLCNATVFWNYGFIGQDIKRWPLLSLLDGCWFPLVFGFFFVQSPVQAFGLPSLITFCFIQYVLEAVGGVLVNRMSLKTALGCGLAVVAVVTILWALFLIPAVSLLIRDEISESLSIAFDVLALSIIGASLNRLLNVKMQGAIENVEHFTAVHQGFPTGELMMKIIAFSAGKSPLYVVAILAGHHFCELFFRQSERFAVGFRRIWARRQFRKGNADPLTGVTAELEWSACVFVHSVRDGWELSAHVMAAYFAWAVGWMTLQSAAITLAVSLSFELAVDIAGIILLRDSGLNALGRIRRPMTWRLAVNDILHLASICLIMVVTYLHGNPLSGLIEQQ